MRPDQRITGRAPGAPAGALGRVLVTIGLAVWAVGLVGAAIETAGVSAQTTCSAPTATSGHALKSINTSDGCDVANGTATDPATGYISIGMPATVTTATAQDAFQALPASTPRFYQGTYVLTLSSCTGGTAVGSTYQVGSGGDFPSSPPTIMPSGGGPAVTATRAGGTVTCSYSLAVAGAPPAGSIASFRNDLWVTYSNGQDTHTATISVKPFEETKGFVTWVSTVASPGGQVGESVNDAAVVSAGAGMPTPTGTVTFTLYGPSTTAVCDASDQIFGPSTVSLTIGTATSPAFEPQAVGTYYWKASFTPVAGSPFAGSDSPCGAANESVNISQVWTKVATVASAGGPAGTSVWDRATVSADSGTATPTGTVTFSLYGPSPTAVCNAADQVFGPSTGTLSAGAVTSPAFYPTQTGTYFWEASYTPAAGSVYASSISSCGAANESFTIGQVWTEVTTVASDGGPAGTSVWDRATVRAGSGAAIPAGNVTFSLYGPSPAAVCNAADQVFGPSTGPLSAGDATSSVFYPTEPGTYYWMASFTPATGSAFASSISTCGAPNESFTIAHDGTTVTTQSSAGGPEGTSVSDTATVTNNNGNATPTGTVTFELYGPNTTAVCQASKLVFGPKTVSLTSGKATSPSFAPTETGTYYWAATYTSSAGSAFASSLSACGAPNESVSIEGGGVHGAHTTAVTTQAGPGGEAGSSVSDTATVTSSAGTPTGTVTFTLYGPDSCTIVAGSGGTHSLVNGSATSSPVGPLSVAGAYEWVASYMPTAESGFSASSSPCGSPNESVVVTAAGAVKGASTPGTGASLLEPGLLAVLAFLLGAILIATGVRRRGARGTF